MSTYTASAPATESPILSTKDWVITLLISFIPIVGFVMLFVWGFSSTENPSKSNWAKAMLIWYAIGMCFLFLLWGTIIAAFIGAGGANNL